MNKESKSKFNLWLSEHPESFHPSDEARMFDFVSLHAYLKYVCDEQRQNYIFSDYVTYTRT